jgi:hypothetical protein
VQLCDQSQSELRVLWNTEAIEAPKISIYGFDPAVFRPLTLVPTVKASGVDRPTKQRQSRKPVTRRSIDWKLVDSVFDPQHARFNFTLEGCAYDEGLNSHGDLPHCSPSDSILERDLSRERVFVNPPWELAKQIAQHFEDCRRTSPTSTMADFVLPKWAKFAQLTKHWKLYQEFPARSQLFTRQSLENPAQQEVVAPAPWHVQL